MFKDLNKFVHNLTLRRHYNMKVNKVSTVKADPSADNHPILNTSTDQQAIQDLCELWTFHEDDDIITRSLHSHSSPPIVHTSFRPKSIFNPTQSKGPYLDIF